MLFKKSAETGSRLVMVHSKINKIDRNTHIGHDALTVSQS